MQHRCSGCGTKGPCSHALDACDVDIAEVGCSSHPEPTGRPPVCRDSQAQSDEAVASLVASMTVAGARRAAGSDGLAIGSGVGSGAGTRAAGAAGTLGASGRSTYPTAGTDVIFPGPEPSISSLRRMWLMCERSAFASPPSLPHTYVQR